MLLILNMQADFVKNCSDSEHDFFIKSDGACRCELIQKVQGEVFNSIGLLYVNMKAFH